MMANPLGVAKFCQTLHLNKDIYKVYLVTFVANLQFFGAITIPFFLDLGHINYKSIFLLESIYTLFLFSTEIPNGIFADKFSRKVALSLGLLFLGLGYITFGFSKDFTFFIVAELFCALGAAFLSGADKALLYELLKKKSLESKAKKYLARMQSWGTMGMALGLPLGSLLVKSDLLEPYPQSLSVTFILSAACSLLVSLVTLSINEEKINLCKKNFIKIGWESCSYVYKNKKLFQLSLNLVLINAPAFFIVWLYQPLLSKANVDIKYFGIVACAFNLLGVFFLRYIDKIEAVFGVRNLLFYSGVLPGILFMMLAFMEEKISCIALVIISASIKSIRVPIIGEYINSEIGNHNRATILSAVSMMQRIFVLFLNPIVGYLCDTSVRHAIFFLGAFIVLMCLYFKKETLN